MGVLHIIVCDELREFIVPSDANQYIDGNRSSGDKFNNLEAALWALAAWTYVGKWQGKKIRFLTDSSTDEFYCIKDPKFNHDFGGGNPDYKNITQEAMELADRLGAFDRKEHRF